MSIETLLSNLVSSLAAHTAALEAHGRIMAGLQAGGVTAQVGAQVQAQPVQQVAAAAQQFVAPVAAAMPGLPSFAQQPAQQVAAALPFNDGPSLLNYVMTVYKQIGPQKGAMIQNILTQLGVANVNDVQPAQYGQFYASVEALKA